MRGINRSFIIGRSPDCDLVINNHFTSRYHAELFLDSNGVVFIRDLGSSNGTGIGSVSNSIREARLAEMDLIFFSEDFPVPGGVLLKYLTKWQQSDGRVRASLTLGDVKVFSPGVVRVGSSPNAHVCLPVLGIAPDHLHIYFDGVWKVVDLFGGVSIDGKSIGGNGVPLTSGDLLELESESISVTFTSQEIIIARQRRGFSLESEKVAFAVKDRTTGEPLNLLSEISFSILPGELVALMGPSGGGKTTLLNILAGVSSASEGCVLYDGLAVKAGDIQMTSRTGYVPQDDLLYGELTVAESLYYSTRYRVPDSVSDAQIKHKVLDVCKALGLNTKIRETLIGSPEEKSLSGGQRKRVNLAMELVIDPLILFLDEPTSGLSSRDARMVVDALRDLATSMCIAVIVTIHQPSMRIYQEFDKVIYIKDGKLVYFGNAFPDGVSYFIQNDPPEVAGADAVMDELENRNAEKAWQQYQNSPAYQKFVEQRSNLLRSIHQRMARVPSVRSVESWLGQVTHASGRYMKCRMRRWQSLLIQIFQGPLVGLLIGVGLGGVRMNTPLFLLVFIAVWFGTNNTARELVGERSLFKREKRSGANVSAMLLSKLSVNSAIALLQCILLVWVSSFFLEFHLHRGLAIMICWLASLVGISIGLLISAWAKTEMSAIVVTPLVLIPLILFGGLLAPLDGFEKTEKSNEKVGAKILTHLMPTRWGYEAMVHAEKMNIQSSKQEVVELSMVFLEFRSKHEGLNKFKRELKIKKCMQILMFQFILLFTFVWVRVRMKCY